MLHGSSTEEQAQKEIEYFFPMEQTVAVINVNIHVLFLFETVCGLSLLLKEHPSICYTAPVQKNKHKRRLNISSQWNRQSLLSNQMAIKPKVSAKANHINVLFALSL